MDKKKWPVIYDWTFGCIGGRELKYFDTKGDADVYANETHSQMVLDGVTRSNVRVGGKNVE